MSARSQDRVPEPAADSFGGGAAPTSRVTVTAALVVVLGALGLGVLSYALRRANLPDETFLAGAFAVYAAVGTILVLRVRTFHPHPRFGLANTITVTRFVLTCLLAGFAFEVTVAGRAAAAPLSWAIFAIAASALVLDGLDGFTARRQGLVSAFGSRFDMEVDALQILFLAILAHAFAKAGPWVLASGVMRYAFVAAGMAWPKLAAPLPYSQRRRAIAGIQGATLAALMAPAVTPPLSEVAAAAALALLVYSFGADIVRLVTPRP